VRRDVRSSSSEIETISTLESGVTIVRVEEVKIKNNLKYQFTSSLF